ncbi:hypothetical protein GPECTOR_3g388 [Gonium pectorale]|uniref:Helicase C-terminal domain-containing protein n=1 Tax=Gonium pectorale TaxID=33097 RepID=A0A150H042_GONPE|nr:hypothetical protein GPECTOR_3g388 [Gonium pectorale]|eukprot:KXZ55248.1 hypothetical protein GPECTOR_3g388 [Gonium pectorale]
MASEATASGLRHYYAAVGNKEAKLVTLLELLQTVQASTRRPLAVSCSSRDALDSVAYTLLRSRKFAVTAIHSDLTEKERELALADFRRCAVGAGSTTESHADSSRDGDQEGAAGRDVLGVSQLREGEQFVSVLVLTDVCLKALPKELLPVGVSVLVEFDLPPSKEVYARRVSTLFGSGRDRRSQRRVVIDMVEAGSIGAFRALESFVASPVLEMPVRVEDMFAQ